MRELIDRIGYVPHTCVWEITRACNLSCAHCGTGAGAPRDKELTTEGCIDVAHQLADLGTRLITLSGGEPTVRRDWPQIARAAVDAGVVVNMVSNGQSGNPSKLAQQVREAGLSNVGISLDGVEETHDLIRKPGAFARATETVRTLSGAGIWVDVMVTVNQLNLHELPQIYRQAWQLGARGFRTQLGKPMGNQTHRDDLTLEPHHMLILLPMLGRLSRAPGPVVHVGDSVGYFSPQEKLLRGHHCSMGHWTGCYAGCRAIGIQADGGVKGCLSLQPREGEPDRFLEGDLQQSSLSEIWLRPGAFAYNRAFTLDDLSGECASCAYAEICRGGAKCVSHAMTGGLSGDPLCFHRAALAHAGRRRRRWAHAASAAAAAMVLGLGAAGCSGMHTSIGPEPDACVDRECDAGADVSVHPEYGDPDYGVIVPADAGPDADEPFIGPDYGEPDYGVIVPTDAGPDADADVGPDPACAEIDCECFVCLDYGLPSECFPCGDEGLYRDCCCDESVCEDPCVDCDYGDPPPTPQQQFCCDFTGNDYGLKAPDDEE